MPVGHGLEDGVDALAQIEGTVEHLADLEEEGVFLHFAANFGWGISSAHIVPPRDECHSRKLSSTDRTKV